MVGEHAFVIPGPEHIEVQDNAIIFKLPSTPYTIIRNSRKQMYRWEAWGLVIYDYKLDQFSAIVTSPTKRILPRAPLGVYWLVNAPCNLKCIHCYGNVEELPRKSLTEAEQNHVADQIIASGAMRVTINGGEPLLRKDTPQIIEKLADADISVVLGTNGTYLNSSIIKSIRRTSLVEISLDSADEATNNSIRQSRVVAGNAYWEALKAIELCLNHDVKFRILTCVNQKNLGHLEATADLLYERGVRDWSVSSTLFAGRARFIYPELVVKEAGRIQKVIEIVRAKYSDLKVKFSNRSNADQNNKYSFLVFPDGRAFAEDLKEGRKLAYDSLLEGPLLNSWTEQNYDIEKHFERWTAGRVQTLAGN